MCPPMARQDGIGSKAPTLRVRSCVSCRLVFVCERVCELFLRDGVPHCETVMPVFCDMLEYLHPCSTISAALRAHWRFQMSHSWLQVSLDQKLFVDCSSAHVLCLCGGLGCLLPCLLSSFGLSLSNLLRGLSQLRLLLLQSSWLLQRPCTVELFAAPPVVSVLLLLKRFLDGLHLASRQISVPLWIHSNPSLRGRGFHSLRIRRPSTPRPSWTCACTRRGPLNLDRAVQCSSLRFRASLSPRISCSRSCKSRPSSSRSHCENRCLAACASGASGRVSLHNLLNFVVCLDCFLRCNFRRCLALVSKLLMSLDCESAR